jgi:hypothetical protein
MGGKDGKNVPSCPASKASTIKSLPSQKLGGRIITQGEPEYPKALVAIEDAPPLISILSVSFLMCRLAANRRLGYSRDAIALLLA